MFRSAFIIATLAMNWIDCSGHASEEDAINEPQYGKVRHNQTLQRLFRFSNGPFMLFDPYGVPHQYYMPRTDLTLLDYSNPGCIKIPRYIYAPDRRSQAHVLSKNKPAAEGGPYGNIFKWRLAASTRAPTDRELESESLWRRDSVPLNRLMSSLESPIFLGHFFYALTSLTEVNGRSILSRFYYAPVLTARYGHRQSGSGDLTVKDIELNVFSICIEPSDAPEDASIPLMHRPQRIIDAGLRKSRQNNVAYDVREKLKENATDKLETAEKHFSNAKWEALFSDSTQMACRKPPAEDSLYAAIKTPFHVYYDSHLTSQGPTGSVFHQYDFDNKAYIFAYGVRDINDLRYNDNSAKLLIFLNPRAHFRDEVELWNMCVELWREEMRARYGTDANSHLVCPHAYLSESESTAPYYEIVPRHEALRDKYDLKTRRRATQPTNTGKPGTSRQEKNPVESAARDMLSNPGLQRASNESKTVTSLKRSADVSTPSKRYLADGAMPGPNRPADVVELANELPSFASRLADGGVSPESGASLSNNLCVPRTSAPLNSGSYAHAPKYWSDVLPRSAGPSNIGVYGNGPLYANPSAIGFPCGLVPQPAFPPLTYLWQFGDRALAAASTLFAVQQTMLGMGAEVPTIQRRAEPMDFAEALTRLNRGDLTILGDPAFLNLLMNP